MQRGQFLTRRFKRDTAEVDNAVFENNNFWGSIPATPDWHSFDYSSHSRTAGDVGCTAHEK
jgi:hypothetical protein